MPKATQNNFSDVPKPKGGTRYSTSEILSGKILPKIDILRQMNEDDFEDCVYEWLDGDIKKRYKQIKLFGGAGDKGRDVVGYYDNGDIDIFQCKHYKGKITPGDIYPELVKICYFSFKKVYPVPKLYTIMSTQGIGPKLTDLIQNPDQIASELIEKWEELSKKAISGGIVLTESLKKHVEKFDFSIIKEKEPLEFITEHGNTIWHSRRFGGGLKTYRQLIPKPDTEIQAKELNYTKQLFEVYSSELSMQIDNVEDLRTNSIELHENFCLQRESFYCAESLDKFSRENYPDADPLPFEELKHDSQSILNNLLLLHRKSSPFERLLTSIQEMHRTNFESNPLSLNKELKPLDKQGICNCLANENKVKWKLNQ